MVNPGTVKFDESQNKIHTIKKEEQEHEEGWYTKPDYRRFKADLLTQVRTFAKIENACGQGPLSLPHMLQEVYNICTETDLSIVDAISDLQPDEADFLRYIYNSPYRADMIGLERYTSAAVTKATRAKREELQGVVSEFQQEFGSEVLSCDEAAEELRESCREITHRYHLFAQYVAIAQRFSLDGEEC